MYRNNFERLEYPSFPELCLPVSQIYKKYFSFRNTFRKENHTLKTLSNTKTGNTLIALNKDADNEADHTDSF